MTSDDTDEDDMLLLGYSSRAEARVARLAELRAKLAGRLVVASVSGGKDSAALSLWLTDQGIEHERVFFDMGWEHPDTYTYLRGPLTAALGPIRELKGARGMADLCRWKGMFPSRTRRFCTDRLKVFPAQAYIRGLQDAGAEVVNAIGIRAAESAARAKLTEWEWSDAFDCETWRPLIRWTEAEVITIHTCHGLRPNPLYLRGHSRVGCWPCIFSRKEELRRLADEAPERIAEIRALEAEVQATYIARHDARGVSVEEAGHTLPTFFQSPSTALTGAGANGRGGVPIDAVVLWARTAHGGRQFELFAPVHEEGCVRWGLCEVAA